MKEVEAPLVHIHTFGERPDEIPTGAYPIDWGDEFNRGVTPRQVPDTDTWQNELLPRLAKLREEIGRRGLLRLQGEVALSVAFAFGYTFKRVGRYQLEVAQSPPYPPQYWRSDETPPAGGKGPEFLGHYFAGNPAAADGVVIVHALPRSLASVVEDVGVYLGEAEVFKEFVAEASPNAKYDVGAIRQLLMAAFSDEELRIFIFDHGEFRPVHEQPAAGMSKPAVAQRLVDFAERHVLLERLLELVKKENPNRYALHEAGLKQKAQSRKFKGVLLLEAEATSKEGRHIEGWEAAALARNSQGQLSDFVSLGRLEVVHLFLAMPFALAVFLGHQWNAIGGAQAQCYEWVGGGEVYAPACLLDLN